MAQSLRQLKVKQLTGPELNLEVDSQIGISDLKLKIKSATGMEPAQQRLIYKARPLEDSAKLSDYVTENDQAIHLVANPGASASASAGAGAGAQQQQRQPQMPPGFPQMPPGGMDMGNIQNMMQNMMQNMQRPGANGGQQPNPMAMLQGMFGPQGGAQQRAPTQSSGASATATTTEIPTGPTASTSGQQASQGQTRQGQQIRINLGSGTGQPTVITQQQPRAAGQEESKSAAPRQVTVTHTSESNTIKMPHEVLLELNKISNRMMGNNATFPGPPMPQLPFDRNPIHLLGSYLTNLTFTLQRMLPYMQRTGDLMSRESLLTQEQQRRQTAEMCIMMGEALEQIAKAAGATAHMYKNFEMGPRPGQCRMKPATYNPMFSEIVKATGSVRSGSQAAQNAAAASSAQPAATTQPEESKIASAAPAQAAAKPEGDSRILARMASEFQQMEMLTIVTGNFQQIKDFKNRCQKVFREQMADGGNTKEERHKMADKAMNALRQTISLPAESRDSIYEQFDPVLITNEILEGSIYDAFEQLMVYEGDDAGFIALVKKLSGDVIVKVISEIEEGFIEGINDVLVFFKANMNNLIMAAAPPQQANMAKGMVIPTAVRFIEKCWNEKSSGISTPAPTPQPAAQPKPVVSQPPQQEEEKKSDVPAGPSINQILATAKSSQERKQMLLARYREQVQKDQAALQVTAQNPPRPLSRAYKALDLNSNNTLVDEEEKLNLQSYQKESAAKAKSLGEFFKAKMRNSILDTGMYPSGTVDTEMKKIDPEVTIPESLKQAYFAMVKAGIKSRLANDNDFKVLKAKNSDRFDYLDKI